MTVLSMRDVPYRPVDALTVYRATLSLDTPRVARHSGRTDRAYDSALCIFRPFMASAATAVYRATRMPLDAPRVARHSARTGLKAGRERMAYWQASQSGSRIEQNLALPLLASRVRRQTGVAGAQLLVAAPPTRTAQVRTNK